MLKGVVDNFVLIHDHSRKHMSRIATEYLNEGGILDLIGQRNILILI